VLSGVSSQSCGHLRGFRSLHRFEFTGFVRPCPLENYAHTAISTDMKCLKGVSSSHVHCVLTPDDTSDSEEGETKRSHRNGGLTLPNPSASFHTQRYVSTDRGPACSFTRSDRFCRLRVTKLAARVHARNSRAVRIQEEQRAAFGSGRSLSIVRPS